MALYIGGGSSRFSTLIIIVVSIILFYVFIWRNAKFQDFVNQLFSGISPAAAAHTTPPTTPTTPETPPAEQPSGTGGISTEPTCPAGEECQEDDQGRYDCDESKGDSYESTWCGSFSGDDLTIKLYGPQHSSDGDCCWCVLHVKPESGEFVGGGEGPHPSSNCQDKGQGESIGSSSNICVKATIEPGPHVVGYALMNGQWQEMINYTADCGCDETSSEKTGDQVTFRCDGDFSTTCATVKPFGGGGGGSTTTPPATTPPANGEDEEEEDGGDGEEEEEEEEGNLARVMRAKREFNLNFNSYRSIRLGNL